MSTTEEPKSARAVPFLARLRQRWRRRTELDAMDPCELERIAGDLGMRGSDLKELAALGPHAASELRERMRLLDLARADAERVAHGMMRDMERTCARCRQKGSCRKDLAAHPHDPSWEGYCPNAAALTAIRIALRTLPAA